VALVVVPVVLKVEVAVRTPATRAEVRGGADLDR